MIRGVTTRALQALPIGLLTLGLSLAGPASDSFQLAGDAYVATDPARRKEQAHETKSVREILDQFPVQEISQYATVTMPELLGKIPYQKVLINISFEHLNVLRGQFSKEAIDSDKSVAEILPILAEKGSPKTVYLDSMWPGMAKQIQSLPPNSEKEIGYGPELLKFIKNETWRFPEWEDRNLMDMDGALHREMRQEFYKMQQEMDNNIRLIIQPGVKISRNQFIDWANRSRVIQRKWNEQLAKFDAMCNFFKTFVIPVKTGIQHQHGNCWIPAFAGMTGVVFGEKLHTA